MPSNCKKQNRKKRKGISVSDFKEELKAGKFSTSKKSRLSKNLPSITSKARKIMCNSIKTRDAVIDKLSIDKKFCDDNNIQYLSELIAQIVSAKKIKSIKIFTPFGDCELKRMGTDNYLAKVASVSVQAGTYDFLLSVIDSFENRDELIKKIKEFLTCEIKSNFAISLKDNIEKNIYNTMKEHINAANVGNMDKQITYPKNYKCQKFKINYKNAAALMCGIFISEMIRTAAKFVRGAFSNSSWPKTVEELREKFLQSDKQGNKKFRDTLTRKSFRYTDVLTRSLEMVSPFKKAKK